MLRWWLESAKREISLALAILENVFGYGRHAILLQEEHRHGILITLYALKSLNAC